MNVFDLFVTIGLKDEATGPMSQVKATTIAAGQLMADAAKTTGKALLNLGKQAIAGFAEYEQLTGGVETLFKTSADTVNQYAQQAYKTAGMSANEYMSTVTGFSASLIQSVGGNTKIAAEYANRAITDMADNANKMGTDLKMIQNAYQGFAKQNYTMLDNLKLGYGGTQAEMQRLIADASRMTDVQQRLGVTVDASSMSFSNIVNAISVMQESLGIAGATAEEAEGTISGSVESMKAAWENLVIGFADENADINVLMDQFLESVEVAAGNIIPVVQRVLSALIQTLADNAPDIVVSGAKLLGELAAGAIKAIPDIIASIPKIVAAIVQGFVEAAPEFQEIGSAIVQGIWEGIKNLGGWLMDSVRDFFDWIVDGVKDKLGIHSPSRVFAGIGGNMALGIEEGFHKEFSAVRAGISRDLNFGTETVGFASSGVSIIGNSVASGIASMANVGAGQIIINLTNELDGAVLARKMVSYNQDEALRSGA